MHRFNVDTFQHHIYGTGFIIRSRFSM